MNKDELKELINDGICFISGGGSGAIHHVPNELIQADWHIKTMEVEHSDGVVRLVSYTEISKSVGIFTFSINLFFEDPFHDKVTE